MTPTFRASSLGRLMTEPKAKAEALSVGAKTYIRELALQDIFGVEFEVSSKEMEKGIEVEDQSIALVNEVRGLSLTKYAGRITRDGLTGEPDCIDRTHNRGHDVKSCWSIKSFRAFAIDCADSLYEWQARAYMALYDVDRYEVNYCMVDTPERLIGYAPMQLHLVSHIPAHLRLTTLEIDRDAALEARIFEKIQHASDYYREVIAEFDRAHPKHQPPAPGSLTFSQLEPTMAIYLVTQNQTQRLISANNQAAARSFAARSTIEVKVATTVEAIALTAAGIKVEDSGNNPDQLLLPEIPVQGDVTPDARWAETV